MNELLPYDLRFIAQRLPRDVGALLATHAGRLMVGGGFIRATIAGEVPSDIDMFGDDKDWLETVASALVSVRPGARIHHTDNAITVLTPNRMTVQFITRWTFGNAPDCVESFDFTICQAAVYREKWDGHNKWVSYIGDRFYTDLAAKRLHYTSPIRDEEVGGSLLRVLKYVRRGYTIQVGSLGAVVARLHSAMKDTKFADYSPADVFTALLREVDPLLVIDGLDVVDDHEPDPDDDTVAPAAG